MYVYSAYLSDPGESIVFFFFFQTMITDAQNQKASFPLECISMNMCDPPTLKAIFVCG